ncbi:MAG: N-acetylglucosamine-6-phosphate deacetylase [Clostridiaceae bacterium]|nr:N-acetylglucosamine-6-phosphate deacetylase [Clostridiaceae bacterium]
MIIKNGHILTDKWQFADIDIAIRDGLIAVIGSDIDIQENEEVIDAAGMNVIPGLIDIHIHGCNGHDFCDGSLEAAAGISKYLASRGVTSFLATSMALPEQELKKVFHNGARVMANKQQNGARMLGIHMEGPFFNKAKKGAQAEKNIIDPDMDMFERLYEAADKKIRLLDVAPELDGAMEMIRQTSDRLKVSLGHTVADYDTAIEAIRSGASHITHLFNAMPAFTHREPGVVGAAMDTDVSVELICDGFHIHPAVVRSVFKMFGADRVVLVSDAMRACGLANGDYELGGQPVKLTDGKAALADGTLAGSATDLMNCMKNAVSFGISLADAVRAASLNPAKVAGASASAGSITVGKSADLLILDDKLALQRVIIGGVVQV